MSTTKPKGRLGYDAAVRRRALALYQDKDYSPERIASKPGMPSAKTIRRWIREAKIKPRPSRKYPRAKIKRLLDKGTPRKVLHEKYGCSYKWLSDLSSGKLEV